MRRLAYSFILLLAFLRLVAPASYAANQISDVRYWSAPDHTRVVIDVAGSASYKHFTLDNPDRLVIDFKATHSSLSQDSLPVNDGIINQIRFGYYEKGVFRMVLDLVKPAETKVFPIENTEGKTERLVIELFRPDLKDLAEMNRTTLHTEAKDKKILDYLPGGN